LNIRDRLKAPVITGDELKSQLLFGKRQAATLIGYLSLTILIYVLVFYKSEPVLDFMGGRLHQDFKVLAAVAVTLFSRCSPMYMAPCRAGLEDHQRGLNRLKRSGGTYARVIWGNFIDINLASALQVVLIGFIAAS